MKPFNRSHLRRCSRTHLLLLASAFRYEDRNTSVLGVAFDNVSQRAKNGRYHATYCKHHKDTYTRGTVLMESSWVDNPTLFGYEIMAAIGLPPTADHSLDRVDNLNGYFVDNLRWATPSEQVANRRILTGHEVRY